MNKYDKVYIAIDLKSFYASVECQERGLNPITTNLVVADSSRTEKTVCLAVSPSLKQYGIPGRARLFEVIQKVNEINAQRKINAPGHKFTCSSYDDIALKKNKDLELSYIIAPPRMSYYMKYSTRIYNIYLKWFSADDIYVYSIDEVFIDVTHYLQTYKTTPRELVTRVIKNVYDEAGRTAKGTAIVNLLNLEGGEKISAIIPIQNFAEGKYLLMATRNGLIKKTPLAEYDSNRRTGLLGITLKEDDELIDVRMTDGEDNVVLVTRKGMSITFDEKDVRPVGRTAQGVIGMRLDEGDYIIGMEPIISGSKATLLAITENGFGKRTELDEYRVQNRGGRGVITYKITPKTGEIVGIKIVTGVEDIMLITDTGTIIRLNTGEISVLGRSTQGVTLMRTNDGKVVSIEKIVEQEEE